MGLAIDALRGRVLPSWDVSRLWRAATSCLPSLAERRLAAIDLLGAGCIDWLSTLGLSAEEVSWLKMRHFADLNDFTAAFSHLQTLPRLGYPDKSLVLWRFLRDVRRDDGARASALEVLEPLSNIPAARLLTGILDRPVGPPEASVETWKTLAQAFGLTFVTKPLARVLECRDFAGSDPSIADLDPMSAALVRLIGRPTSASWSLQPADVARLPRRTIDCLVRAGELVEASDGADGVLDERKQALLRPWLHPELVTDDELAHADGNEELARRRFMAEDSALHEMDASLPGVAKYQLLDQLRAGNPSVVDRLAPLLPPGLAERATGYGQFLSGTPAYAVSHILQDSSIIDVAREAIATSLASADLSAGSPVGLGWFHLSQAIARTHQWDWDDALRLARQCLATAQDEHVRDEALNVMAFALLQKDQPEAALSALNEALRGEYTVDLVINAGIVARELSQERAAQHLARVATEAPSLPLRVGAAVSAIRLWQEDPEPWRDDLTRGERPEGSESEGGLPEPFRILLRDLIKEDLSLDEFRQIVGLLANHDSEWLKKSGAIAASKHAATREGRLYAASIAGLEGFVQALGAALQEKPEPWLEDERDRLLAMVHVFQKRESGPGPGRMALLLLDWLPLPQPASDMLVATSLVGLQLELSTAGSAYNRLIDQIRMIPPRRINERVVSEAVRPIRELALDAQTQLNKLRSKTEEASLREGIDELAAGAQEILALSRRWGK